MRGWLTLSENLSFESVVRLVRKYLSLGVQHGYFNDLVLTLSDESIVEDYSEELFKIYFHLKFLRDFSEKMVFEPNLENEIIRYCIRDISVGNSAV